VFTTGTTDTFTMLDQLAADLLSGNNAGITGALTTLDQNATVVSGAQARIGAATGLVERALMRNSSQQITLRSDLANVEDIDLTEAVTDLSRQQAAYQAALGATSKSIQQSLVDWLR
jgi:flagellar hook-associated protein 3 FlgL